MTYWLAQLGFTGAEFLIRIRGWVARFDFYYARTFRRIAYYLYYVESGTGNWKERCLNGIDCTIGNIWQDFVVHTANKYHGALYGVYCVQYSHNSILKIKVHDCHV